jgi:single-stranded-DNA-specific exonuclease
VVFEEFHNGIIGIIASRITDKYKKPAIVISHKGTGSARSVNGTTFSIINVIKDCSEFLTKFGGHKAAAGLSLKPDPKVIDMFRTAIQHAAQKEVLSEPVTQYIRQMDIKQFPTDLFEEINYLEPYGINISKPMFYCPTGTSPDPSLFGKKNEHLKLHYEKKEVVAFFKGSLSNQIIQNSPFDFLYTTLCCQKQNFLVNDLRIRKSS